MELIKRLLLPQICYYEYKDVELFEDFVIDKKIRWEVSLWFDISFYSYIYTAILSNVHNMYLLDAYGWLFLMNFTFWFSAIIGISIFRRND